jgi:hypothetical protein
MIKRNSKNLGKLVTVRSKDINWDGRWGKVVGFRGDFVKGDPWVSVFIMGLNGKWHGVFPFPGSRLEIRKENS